jgi:hypothetical protein
VRTSRVYWRSEIWVVLVGGCEGRGRCTLASIREARSRYSLMALASLRRV